MVSGTRRSVSGDRVLVLGGGTIGLLAAAVARTRSDDVTVSVRYPHQRAVAESLGVTVLDEAEVHAWGKQARPNVVIETVGASANTLDTAIAVARRGGTIVVLGTFANIPVDLFAAGQKELVFRNSFAYAMTDGENDFEVAARTLVELRQPLAAMVTHRFDLADVASAFECAGDKSTGAIKVAVEVCEPPGNGASRCSDVGRLHPREPTTMPAHCEPVAPSPLDGAVDRRSSNAPTARLRS